MRAASYCQEAAARVRRYFGWNGATKSKAALASPNMSVVSRGRHPSSRQDSPTPSRTTSNMTHSSPSIPSTPPDSPLHARSKRPPLVGVIAGIALVAGVGLWTLQRIGEAKTFQSGVEARRSAESQRAATLASEPLRVNVMQGIIDRWQPRVELDGTLEAVHDAELGFRASGRLAHVYVQVGDRVPLGGRLADLDDTEVSAQVTAAEAQVRAAEASLALAVDNERRTLPLVQNHSIAEANGVQATEQRQLAAAQLDGAKAQVAITRAALANHALKAPFAGTITRAPTGIGAVVNSGQALFGLVDTTTLKLATTVSEEDANLLERGSEVHLAAAQNGIVGRVSAVLATLDARTRRVPLVVEFDNAQARAVGPALRAGGFVRGWVEARNPIAVLRVPHGVLRPGARDEVWTLDAASRLEPKQIVFAIAPNGDLLVRKGIQADDWLVLDPIAEAKAGEVVQRNPKAASESGAESAKAGTP
jgi:RND family efflux transporter MFP subunit